MEAIFSPGCLSKWQHEDGRILDFVALFITPGLLVVCFFILVEADIF